MAELHTSFQDNSRSDIASRINTQLNAQNDLEKRVDALHTEFQSLSKEVSYLLFICDIVLIL